MFSDDNNFANPQLAPKSSSEVKVIKMTPYPGINATGPVYNPTEEIIHLKLLYFFPLQTASRMLHRSYVM